MSCGGRLVYSNRSGISYSLPDFPVKNLYAATKMNVPKQIEDDDEDGSYSS